MDYQYYKQVVALVGRAFDSARSDSLTDIDVSGLSAVWEHLFIPFNSVIASEASFTLPEITGSSSFGVDLIPIYIKSTPNEKK